MELAKKQFELGDEKSGVERPHGRTRGMVLSVRLGPEEAERLYAAAAQSGRKLSDLARAALDAYLAPAGTIPTDAILNVSLAITPSGPAVLNIVGSGANSQLTYAPPHFQEKETLLT